MEGEKMKKGIVLGLLALFVVGIFAMSAFALPEDTKDKIFGKDSKIRTALSANDYESWKIAITETLTKEKFDQAVKKYQTKSSHREEMDSAIAEGYTAWAKLVEGKPVADVITADNFDQLVKMHNAKKSGDYETAKEIADSLGLKKPGRKGGCMGGNGQGQGRGMHGGQGFGMQNN